MRFCLYFRVGDTTYPAHLRIPDKYKPLEAERLMLHCWQLKFPDGEHITAQEPLSGYLNQDNKELELTLKKLHNRNVCPALSCGMHPGLVNKNKELFGPDFIANVGGAIHGHPNGTLSGAIAMRQAIDEDFGKEYEIAIEKWGLKT